MYESSLVTYNELYKNEGRLKLLSDDASCVGNDVALTSAACDTAIAKTEIWEFLP